MAIQLGEASPGLEWMIPVGNKQHDLGCRLMHIVHISRLWGDLCWNLCFNCCGDLVW